MVEVYLDVCYLRTPDLPKDDIARALGARGGEWKGAGQKLLLMVSRGLSHSFVVFNALTVFYHPTLSLCKLPDSFDVRPFKPRPVPRRQEPVVRPCSSISQTRPFIFLSFGSTYQAFPHPGAFLRKFGTRSRASSPGTFSAGGFLYLHSITTHRDIALRRIFRTVDLYLYEDWN